MHGLGRNRQPSTLNTNLDSYDNKLVSSTLVNSVANEPISPISSVFSSSAQNPPSNNPFSSGNTTNVGLGVNVNHILHPSGSSSPLLYHHHPSHPYNNNALPSGSGLGLGLGGRAFSRSGGSSGLTGSHGGSTRNVGTNVNNDSHPSHPSSPWSVVTLTVLPVFNGTPLLTPIEDLNALVSSHITSSISRSPQAYRSLLSSDLQEIISSGMLTLKAKLDPLIGDREGLKRDPGRFVARVGEVWAFFFGIVPYMQGIFLPLSLLPPAEPRSNSKSDRHLHSYPYEEEEQDPDSEPEMTTDPRRLLLSGFMLHILLPILPALLSVLEVGRYGPDPASSSTATTNSHKRPGPDRTQRGRRVDPDNSSHLDLSSPPLLDPPDPGPGQGQGQGGKRTYPYPAPPNQDQLGRLQHMALIISTQGKRSVFFSFTGGSVDSGEAEEAWRREKEGRARERERSRSRQGDNGRGSRNSTTRAEAASDFYPDRPDLDDHDEDKDEDDDEPDMGSDWGSRIDQEEIDRDRVEDLLRAVVRLKNGGVDPASTSGIGMGFGQGNGNDSGGLMRSSNVGPTSPGSSSGPHLAMGMGMGMGNVPRPRRRGNFPGVALRGDRGKGGLDGRDRSRGTSRSREREGERGGRSTVGSSEEDEVEVDSRPHSHSRATPTDQGAATRRKTVDEFGVSTKDDRDQTPTITDLNRRTSRIDVSHTSVDEETVRPRVV